VSAVRFVAFSIGHCPIIVAQWKHHKEEDHGKSLQQRHHVNHAHAAKPGGHAAAGVGATERQSGDLELAKAIGLVHLDHTPDEEVAPQKCYTHSCPVASVRAIPLHLTLHLVSAMCVYVYQDVNEPAAASETGATSLVSKLWVGASALVTRARFWYEMFAFLSTVAAVVANTPTPTAYALLEIFFWDSNKPLLHTMALNFRVRNASATKP